MFIVSLCMTRFVENYKQELIRECKFTTSRSQGPGGQNVNKVNSKVELRFDIEDSTLFNPEQKSLLLKKLKTRISSENILILSSQISRSQAGNKKDAIEKLFTLLEKALKKPKKRIPTKASRSSVEKRISNKKKLADKKNKRGKISDMD